MDPSPGSWERLSGQLPEPPRKKGWAWKAYALAACCAGLLLAVLTTLDRELPPAGDIQLVEGEAGTGEGPGIGVDPGQQGNVKEEMSLGEGRPGIVDRALSTTRVLEEDSNRSPEPLAVGDGAGEIDGGADALILQKVSEVVAQVEHLERLQQVSDREVDSLLRAAQQQILRDRTFQKDGRVDALALLAEVEGELDASFRERVFEALKAGYLKMRTAVAERND